MATAKIFKSNIGLFLLVDCFRPYIDCTEDQGADEDNEDKPKSIFEREDLFKDPIEEKD